MNHSWWKDSDMWVCKQRRISQGFLCLFTSNGKVKNEDGERNAVWVVVGKTWSRIPASETLDGKIGGIVQTEGKDKGRLGPHFVQWMLFPIEIWRTWSLRANRSYCPTKMLRIFLDCAFPLPEFFHNEDTAPDGLSTTPMMEWTMIISL